MDVVFITDHLIRGGADRQLHRIATTLQRRGWRVGVITMLPSVAYLDDLRAAGVAVHECSPTLGWPPAMAFRVALRMTAQLRRWRPSVVITFNYHGDIMGRICGRLAGVRAVVSSLRTAHVKNGLRRQLYRRTERLIALTASNSHAGIAYMVARGLLTPAKTLVIPNGIEAADFPSPVPREEVRAEFGLGPDDFAWLAVGNLRAAKDYPTLLAALALCGGAHLLIAGDGEDEAALRADAQRRGLDGRVRFLGSRTDVGRLLKGCDAYVLSSAWEGLPNTVMEAMAAGVPVVSTDAGGVRELVVEGVTGRIVPCGDPAALAGRMGDLMALPPAGRLAMGAAGRARIETHFDNDRVVDRWETLIRQVVHAASGTPPRVEAAVARVVAPPPPAFVISLDFELMWGVRGGRTVEGYGDHILGEREAVPAMLALFKRHGVRATWAAVGMSLFETRKDLLAHLPGLRPAYARRELNPYLALDEIGEDERSDPYHFGLSLVRQVLDCEGMELGSHTFSHFYCLEAGQDAAMFKADLAAWKEAARPLGAGGSFVFPRNQFNQAYLAACREEGFTVFRGNEAAWMYEAGSGPGQSLLTRGARVADHYLDLSGPNGFVPRPWLDTGLVNCPSSRFLRPFSPRLARFDGLRVARIRKAMERAARRGESFHLWWHPHNFGTHLRENLAILDELLRFHVVLRDRYGVVPMTMGEVGERYGA